MNKTLKTKWLKALRGGRYKQTTGVLESRKAGKYQGNCCLGVLCRVAKIKVSLHDDYVIFGGNVAVLSTELKEKFGLDMMQTHTLIKLNDNDRKTFPEIANYIEEYL